MCKGPVVGRILVSVRAGKSGAGEVGSGLSRLGRGSPHRALPATLRDYYFPLRIGIHWRVLGSVA